MQKYHIQITYSNCCNICYMLRNCIDLQRSNIIKHHTIMLIAYYQFNSHLLFFYNFIYPSQYGFVKILYLNYHSMILLHLDKLIRHNLIMLVLSKLIQWQTFLIFFTIILLYIYTSIQLAYHIIYDSFSLFLNYYHSLFWLYHPSII